MEHYATFHALLCRDGSPLQQRYTKEEITG